MTQVVLYRQLLPLYLWPVGSEAPTVTQASSPSHYKISKATKWGRTILSSHWKVLLAMLNQHSKRTWEKQIFFSRVNYRQTTHFSISPFLSVSPLPQSDIWIIELRIRGGVIFKSRVSNIGPVHGSSLSSLCDNWAHPEPPSVVTQHLGKCSTTNRAVLLLLHDHHHPIFLYSLSHQLSQWESQIQDSSHKQAVTKPHFYRVFTINVLWESHRTLHFQMFFFLCDHHSFANICPLSF